MAVVASLDVILSASIAKFESGMNRARRSLRDFTNAVRSPQASLNLLFSPQGAAIAAAALFAATMSKAAKEVSRLADVSSKLGIDPNALRAFEIAAKQTGVATTQLELGLQRMTRRIAEAAQGTGEAQNALKELGLNARELATAGTEESFKRISDAMVAVKNPADRVRLAFKLFDAEGVNLVRTLSIGREGFDELGRRIAGAAGELDNKFIAALKRTEAAATELWELLKSIGVGTLQRFGKEIQAAGDLFIWLNEKIATVNDVLTALESVLIGPLWQALRVVLPAVRDVTDATDQALSKFTEEQELLAEQEKRLEAAKKKMQEFRMAQEEARKAAFDKHVQRINNALADLNGRLRPPITSFQQFLKDVRTANDLFAAGALSAAGRNELVALANVKRIREERERMAEVEEKMRRSREKAARAELDIINKRIKAVETERDKRIAAIRAANPSVTPAAIERGTSEAFSAFRRAGRDADVNTKILEENKKATRVLERLERSAAFIKKAEGI